MKIEIEKIKVKERRKLNDLTTLKNSIKEIGLLNPITISDTNELIAGGHRLQACIELGYTHIECNVLNLDDDLNGLKQELAEIDENLIRNNGTVLEQSDWLKRSKEIYETLYPEVRKGGTGNKPRVKDKLSFTEDTADRTGLNKRTISRKTSIDITPEAKDIIEDLPISNNQSELQRLTKETPTKQVEIAEKLKEGSKSVKEAKKKIQIETRKEVAIEVKIDNSFEYNKLFNGDSVAILKTFPDNIVDCVVMDPPYGIDYKDTRESFNPKFNDGFDESIKLLDETCNELKRICKSDAHIYCFFGPSEYIAFFNTIHKHFPHIEPIPIVWNKNNHTMCDFNKKWAIKYESIFFISNGERNLNYPVSRNVLDFPIPTKKLHQTQKPLDLCEYLIKDSTVEGEVILDPFMGSGTTPLAAKNNNRKYLGIELEQDIYNIAIERVETITKSIEKIDDFWDE